MQFEETGFKLKIPKRKAFRVSAFRMRALSTLLAAGFLCFVCFYVGSKARIGEIEKLEIELMGMKSMLTGIPRVKQSPHEISKRSASESGGDEVVQRVTSLFDGGATYKHWGRRDCPSGQNTDLIYQGIAAGTHYTHTGGGSNLLCLHYNVTYRAGKYSNGNQGSSHIHGIEYRMGNHFKSFFDLTDIEDGSYSLQAMPCALCMAKGRVTQVMIPGRDECPKNWVKEYAGFIVGPAHTHKHNAEYICLNEKPHVIPGSGGDQAGELLYMAEVQCPTVQCEPYVQGREIRCVVCTI